MELKKIFPSCVQFGLILIFASCGASSTSPSLQNNSGGIEGTWRTACQTGLPGSRSSYSYIELTFTNGAYSNTQNKFSDSTCSVSTETDTESGSYILGDAVSTPDGARKIDLIRTVAYTPVPPPGDNITDPPRTKVTTTNTAYTVYKLDGNNLYFGEQGSLGSATDCSADDKRPTSLASIVLVRQ